MRYLWYSMYAFVGALAIYSLFFMPKRRQNAPPPPPVAVETPVAVPSPLLEGPKSDVQIALLLDTSSSMDGLIEQARVQLWEIVGELQTDEKDQDRTVTVALYQYGNSRLQPGTDFIERLSELTPELDAVSVRLHSLSTSGGKEYAPLAISRAVNELAWSDEDDVEKIIVIAGNEGFSQGSMNADTAMTEASNKGIKVITIFCANGGATSTGLASWNRAAQLAGTKLETIDPDKVVAKIETPYDAKIVEKYQELEKTRLTYGDASFRQQSYTYEVESATYAQRKSVALQADRAVTQARQNRKGDLLRAYGDEGVSLETMDQGSLPTELQGLSREQQDKEIRARQARRAKLETELKDLSKQREGYMSQAPQARPSAPSLGSSVRASLNGY